jgi:hypothetical protein
MSAEADVCSAEVDDDQAVAAVAAVPAVRAVTAAVAAAAAM